MAVREEVVVAELPASQRVRWGALIGGLLLTAATGWLLSLLGSALGLSIADATDADAVGAGFGIGLVLWMLVSWWLAYFAGALLTARLAATPDKTVGVLHGVTLWALAASVTFLLGFFGVKQAVTGTAKALTATSKVVGAAAGAAGAGAGMAAANGGVNGNGMDGGGMQSLLPPEIRNSVMASVKRQASQVAADVAKKGGENVDPVEVQEAVDRLDADTLGAVATELIMDRPEGAKDVLTARTNLDEREVDAIVNGAQQAVREDVQEAKQKLEEATEKASTYAQAALWTTFIGAAVALVAAIVGGMLGAQAVQRQFAVLHSTTTTH